MADTSDNDTNDENLSQEEHDSEDHHIDLQSSGEGEDEPHDPGHYDFSTHEHAPERSSKKVYPWLLTFTDITALMLTFFVLLYTMSMPEEKEWSRMTKALNLEFNKYIAYAPNQDADTQDSINIDKVNFSRALDLNYLSVLLQSALKDRENAQNILFLKRKDRLVISMPNDLLFAPGRATVLSEGRRTLFTMGEALSKIRNRIEVIGHTDPRPVDQSNDNFESNWHLSLSRAANVAGILENTGYRKPITITGMSSARYDELPEDLAEEKRLNLSRRVDIVILRSTGRKRHTFDLGF